MSSNSEKTVEGTKDVLTATTLQSSSVTTTSSSKSSDINELDGSQFLADTTVKRLQDEDDRQELFQHLPETYSLSHRLRKHGWSTLRYLTQTEVHTYAFSVAANAILSFFPFLVLLLTLIRRVIRSQAMYNVVLGLLRDYLPSNKDFVIRNLQFLASVRGRGQVLSFLMLLITSTGIFLPLEVALNRIWGFKKNRSYLMNLVVSLGLALACGCLAMLSIALTAQNLKMLGLVIGDQNFVFARARIHRDESFGDPGYDWHLLPDLLGAAERQGPGASGAAGGDHHRPAVGGGEVYLHLAAAEAELSGSVRTIRGFGHPNVLVVLEWNAVAGRRLFVGG